MESAANLFGGLPPKRATRAVIGTLRPTDRRRASLKFQKSSGAEGDRTPDLCSAIAALSQLSYSPARTRRTALEPDRADPSHRIKAKAPRDWRGRSDLNLADPPPKSIPNFSIGPVTLCLASRYRPATRDRTRVRGEGNNERRIPTQPRYLPREQAAPLPRCRTNQYSTPKRRTPARALRAGRASPSRHPARIP